MKEKMEAHIILVDDDLKFRAESGLNTPVLLDAPDESGTCEGYSALQLFLMSLADCCATAVTRYLRELNRHLEGIEVKATGIRDYDEPYTFKQIYLNFSIDSPDTNREDMLKAFFLAENSYCPVWHMIRGNVEVQPLFSIRSPMMA